MIRSYRSMLAASALAAICRSPDDGGAAAATVSPGHVEWEFPNLEGKVEFDVSEIPGDARLDFLKGAVRAYIANRLNGVQTRHNKEPAVIAWFAYDEAAKADPLQTAVPKPDVERPAAPNYAEALERALADLRAGNVRKVGVGEPKARKVKDPLVATVTTVVEREVFESKRAADPKYSFLMARKEVGGDGIAYLNALIEAKVAAGADRSALEKMRDTKYINPAKAMLGLTSTKAVSELPSIL